MISELEELRKQIVQKISDVGTSSLQFDATLWGWNYGFDFAASGYRLHASHQQIHQQFAMIPKETAAEGHIDEVIPSYNCGDLVADFVRLYNREHNSNYFVDYIEATKNNRRFDDRDDLPADRLRQVVRSLAPPEVAARPHAHERGERCEVRQQERLERVRVPVARAGDVVVEIVGHAGILPIRGAGTSTSAPRAGNGNMRRREANREHTS